MDFHSTQKNVMYPIIKKRTTFPEDFTYRWIDDVKPQYNNSIDVEPFDVQSPITKNWIYREFGADAVTFEVGDTTSDESIRELARLSADAIMNRLLEAYEDFYKPEM
jgi:predicted nucleotidyltransferase